MPLYEYTCPACGHRAEKVRPVADRDCPLLCTCNDLEGTPMQRVLTAPAKVWHPTRSMEQGGKLAEY